MRIAYIAPYQGPALQQKRPSLANLALAGNLKIELVADLLHQYGHDVEIISQGLVVENSLRYFPGFTEAPEAGRNAPVHYASCFPVRFLNGLWSTWGARTLFANRHHDSPFDLVMIYNLDQPQVECARLAARQFGLPVIVEYEDDVFVNIAGIGERGFVTRLRLKRARDVLDFAAGCVGVSPFLLSRFKTRPPQILLRGVVSNQVMEVGQRELPRSNRVVFSGTLFRSKGLVPLIKAWKLCKLERWELHIAGDGELATKLREMARDDRSIVFHGLLGRDANAALLGTAAIGINPHDVSATPGNVFAFKIIEYLAAGAHVITTRMGELEPELECGITYLQDNEPETIAAVLRRVVDQREFERRATRAAQQIYGPKAVGDALDQLVKEVVRRHRASSASPLLDTASDWIEDQPGRKLGRTRGQ
jgi:glycosyltransferase involved in cell wall biosynthesis